MSRRPPSSPPLPCASPGCPLAYDGWLLSAPSGRLNIASGRPDADGMPARAAAAQVTGAACAARSQPAAALTWGPAACDLPSAHNTSRTPGRSCACRAMAERGRAALSPWPSGALRSMRGPRGALPARKKGAQVFLGSGPGRRAGHAALARAGPGARRPSAPPAPRGRTVGQRAVEQRRKAAREEALVHRLAQHLRQPRLQRLPLALVALALARPRLQRLRGRPHVSACGRPAEGIRGQQAVYSAARPAPACPAQPPRPPVQIRLPSAHHAATG